MSLKDLISEVHGPGELVPAISQYLRKRSLEPSDREPGWHPSQFAGMCCRQYVLEKLIGSKVEPHDDKTLRIFDLGTAIHELYQNVYLAKMGILWGRWRCIRCRFMSWGYTPDSCSQCGNKKSEDFSYAEIPVRAKIPDHDAYIVGSSDGIVLLRGKHYLLEIKSIGSYGYAGLDEARDYQVTQARLYAELIRQGLIRGIPSDIEIPTLHGIVMLYVGKNDSREKEFLCPVNEEEARTELKKPYIVEQSFRTKILPEKQVACTNMLKEPAKKCSVCSYCFGSKSWVDMETRLTK